MSTRLASIVVTFLGLAAFGPMSGVARAQEARPVILPGQLDLPLLAQSHVINCIVSPPPEGWSCASISFDPGPGDRGTQYLDQLREAGWQRGEGAEYAWAYSRTVEGCSQSLLVFPHLDMVTWVGFTFMAMPNECGAEASASQ